MYIIRLAQFILKKRLPPSRGGLGAKGGGVESNFYEMNSTMSFNFQRTEM